jgi:hypothetical protein
MANQYHDETGKFCSREEMGAAVDRLALKDVNKALELSKELSSIQASNDAELRAQLNAFINSEPVASALNKPAPTRPVLNDDERAEMVARAYSLVNQGADNAAASAMAVDDIVKRLDAKGLRQVLSDPQAPHYVLLSAFNSVGKERGAEMALESNNPRAAFAYADEHGWPTGKGNLEFEELASKATDTRSKRMFARYTESAFGADHVLQDPDTDGRELTYLAGNPNITIAEAQQIVGLGAEHVGTYPRIRRELLRNPTVGPRLRASLKSEGEAVSIAPRPARISDNDADYLQTLLNLDAEQARLLKITANPRATDDAIQAAELKQVTVERQRRNVVAEFNASDPKRVEDLRATLAAGATHPDYERAETALDDVRGYLMQLADYNSIHFG